MEIRIYDTFENETLRKRWKEIVDMNGYFVQNSYEWCSTWWKYFRNKNRKLYIMTVLQDGDIVGIAPMFIQSRVGFRQLRFVGTGLTDFHQFLVDIKFYRNATEAILEHLMTFGKWHLVYLDQINDEDNLYEYLNTTQGSRSKYRVGCPIIDVNGLSWDEYISNIKSSRLRKNYRKKSRILKREADLDLLRVSTEKQLHLYIDRALGLHIERWSSKGENSKLKQDDLRSFIKVVFLLLVREGKALLYVLKDRENLISYRLGFIQNGVLYAWNTSFNVEYYRYSPGTVLMGHLIRDVIERGYRMVHLMRGDHEYKRQWMHKDREHISNNYLFLLAKSNLKGRILQSYYLSWRDKVKEAFELIISNRHFRSILRLDRQ